MKSISYEEFQKLVKDFIKSIYRKSLKISIVKLNPFQNQRK